MILEEKLLRLKDWKKLKTLNNTENKQARCANLKDRMLSIVMPHMTLWQRKLV